MILETISTKILWLTPFLNSIPYYLFAKPNNIIQNIVRYLIPVLAITTILFWWNPIQNSWIHYIDKGIVVIFATLSIGYVLSCKNMHRILWFFYGIVLSLGTYFVCLSKYYSSINWCSPEHLWNHLGFQLCAHMNIWFVFL